jgi:hypothetical protein
MDFLRPYQRHAQINDWHFKSLICEESGNHAFRFPRSKKPRMDFLRPYQSNRLQIEILDNIQDDVRTDL